MKDLKSACFRRLLLDTILLVIHLNISLKVMPWRIVSVVVLEMDSRSLLESLVMDLVDNWRDESHTQYIGWKLLHILQTNKENVISLLDNKTVIVNLYFVIFEVILKYDFRLIFARINKIIASTPHGNSMFLFHYMTAKQGHGIYKYIRLNLKMNNIEFFDMLLKVRASYGKRREFRLDYHNVSETGYAWLAHNKVALYRDYFVREELNMKLCTLVLSELFGSLIGPHAVKDTFCKNNGLIVLMNLINKKSWDISEDVTSRTVLLCNVIGFLFETEALNVLTISIDDDVRIFENIIEVILKNENDGCIIESALALLLKSLRFFGGSTKSATSPAFVIDTVNGVKTIHSDNMNIYQSSGILQMMISAGEKKAEESGLHSQTGHRSIRWKTWVRENRRKQRAQSTKEKASRMPASSVSASQLPENDRPSRANSLNLNTSGTEIANKDFS